MYVRMDIEKLINKIKWYWNNPLAKPAIVLILMIFVFIKCNGSSETSSPEISSNNYKVQLAFRSAKDEMRKNLKSPSTAKFANEFDKESKYRINSDGSIYIQSYVDAQNSFGSQIRTNYSCTIDSNGKVKDLLTW